MDDLIRRSEAIDAFQTVEYPWKVSVRRILTQVPAVDAVEVVRCESCDMANSCSDEQEMYCTLYHAYKPIDYFCADGRRKDEHNALD